MMRDAIGVHLIAGALSFPLAGCDPVPTLLTFDQPDAASDSPSDATEADMSSTPDAPMATSPDASCPDTPPPGATACCNSVPCNGDCDAHCAECESKCSSAQLCCAKNTAVCHANFICN
jgi:hypothetical protein